MENWEGTVRHAQNLIKKGLSTGDYSKENAGPLENAIQMDKLNIYMPFRQIVQVIKKELIRNASETLDKSKTQIRSLYPNLYSASLWESGFEVVMRVNIDHILEVNDYTSTPYATLVNSLNLEVLPSFEIINLNVLGNKLD